MKEYFIERHGGGERAILVQIDFSLSHFNESLLEFAALANAARVKSLATITGRRKTPSPKYFVGQGKAEEIAQTVNALQAEVVLVNHELTPAQARNLENLCKCRVLDRTELILDIFAQRARTFEGKLQVELAQLKHLSSRLVKGWTHLERQKGGIGLRGPGETQLETDRRLLAVRIKHIKKRLEKVVVQRSQGRRARQRAEIPIVALVGYTNAGKSTLFNLLTHSDVYVADQLFATLDPTLRKISLPPIGSVILVDTVGFIRDLPHDLVAAFRATLEETRQANLLLHVIDAHEAHKEQVIKDVEKVIKEIEADFIPCLQVYNKLDLCENIQPRIDRLEDGRPYRVWLSSKTEVGMPLLEQAILELLSEHLIHCQLTLTNEQADLRARLYQLGAVVEEEVNEQGEYILQLEIKAADYKKYVEE